MDLSAGVNGVFKGGGAKGVVYAGALRAAAERGIRFRAVAGSSAGAITAALVACGLSADELERATSDALGAVRWRTVTGFVPGSDKSVFSVDRLEQWLDERLRAAVPDATGPVTFETLFAATQIELNVVAVDLARKQPVVFNHVTSPHCVVASAVVASCAIPVVMPAGRVVMRRDDGTEEIHRVVDGGAWANYPAFVFKDQSFRKSRGLENSAARPTIGFVINPPESALAPGSEQPVALDHRRRSIFDRGSGAAAGIVGSLLNGRALRVGALVATPVVLAVTLFAWLQSQLHEFFPVVNVLPNVLEPLAVILLVLLLSTLMTLTIGVAIVLLRIGRELFDVGLPSAFAALSVGPGVPDWIGLDATDPVVRLSSPRGVKTTNFRIKEKVRAAAIAEARREAAHQLDAILSTEPPPTPATAAAPAGDDHATYWKRIFTNTWGAARFPLGCVVVLAFAFGARLAIGMARAIAGGQDAAAARSGAVLAAGTLALLYLLARKRRARLLDPPPRRSAASVWAQAAATGFVLALLTWLIFNNLDQGSLSRFESATKHAAVVTRVLPGDTTKQYAVELDAPLPPLKGGTARRYCGTPRRRTCIVFDSLLTDLHPRDRTRVLFIPETSEAFLAGEEWRTFKLDATAFNLGIWLAFGLFFGWAVEDLRWNWRLSRSNGSRSPSP